MHGNQVIWACIISDGISYSLDTEISPSHPESWVKRYLEKLFPKVMEQLPGCELIKCNIQPDHIHMVMVIPPKYAVSRVIGRMKGMTSSELRKKFEWLSKRYWRENVVWSPGYFVSTVGIEEEKILKYVEYQGRQDSGQAKLDL